MLVPFVTVTLGALLAGERLSAGALAGGAVVLLGVWVGALTANSGPDRSHRASCAASACVPALLKSLAVFIHQGGHALEKIGQCPQFILAVAPHQFFLNSSGRVERRL